MKKERLIRVAAIGILIMGQVSIASALMGSSANYRLEVADITNSGSVGSSSGYQLTTGIVGDNADGKSSSAGYKLCAGFVEETSSGCLAAPPPPPPPPPGGPTPPVAGGVVYHPPSTQQTLETQIVPTTQQTTETQVVEPIPTPTPIPEPAPAPAPTPPPSPAPGIFPAIQQAVLQLVNDTWCEKSVCEGKPAQLLKASSLEVPGGQPMVQITISSWYPPAVALGLVGVLFFLAFHYDQRVARMRQIWFPPTRKRKRKKRKGEISLLSMRNGKKVIHKTSRKVRK